MSEAVVIEVELKSPIERVWNALTDSETLSQWMIFKTNDFKPEVGHKFQLSGVEGWDGSVKCEVLEVDEPNRLSYSWTGVGEGIPPNATVVTFVLTDTGAGATHLQFEQSGFDPNAEQEITGATYSWQYMTAELEKTLA